MILKCCEPIEFQTVYQKKKKKDCSNTNSEQNITIMMADYLVREGQIRNSVQYEFWLMESHVDQKDNSCRLVFII